MEIDLDSITPDEQGGYHLQASPHQTGPPTPPLPAWISRKNVSLAAVLERRALDFKFSCTFPLNGTSREGEEGEKEGMGDGLS